MLRLTDNGKMYQFLNKDYISLETYKRSGKGVSTPVWFVIDEDKIFIRSYANSGKVKRMRNNPDVKVCPSDALGRPHGLPIKGKAIRMDGDGEIRVSQLLYRKYGLMKMSFDLWGAIKQLDWAVFVIEV